MQGQFSSTVFFRCFTFCIISGFCLMFCSGERFDLRICFYRFQKRPNPICLLALALRVDWVQKNYKTFRAFLFQVKHPLTQHFFNIQHFQRDAASLQHLLCSKAKHSSLPTTVSRLLLYRSGVIGLNGFSLFRSLPDFKLFFFLSGNISK